MESFVIRTAIAAVLLLVLSETVCCRFVHKIEDYNKPMHEHVAECRKGCLLKFLDAQLNLNKADACSNIPNCFMCWDYCSMLFRERKKKFITKMMCTDDICFAGCKFACNYFQYILAKPMHRTDFFL